MSNILIKGLYKSCPDCRGKPLNPGPGCWIICRTCKDLKAVRYANVTWLDALNKLYESTAPARKLRQELAVKRLEKLIKSEESVVIKEDEELEDG